MKIGLVRHYPVKKGMPEKKLVTPEELAAWFADYDQSDVKVGEPELGGIARTRCFTSDMPRAVKTAEVFYRGEIIPIKELREIPYPDFAAITTRKLPFLLWAMVVRLAWHFNHKAYAENKAAARRRIGAALDRILSRLGEDENVLLVTHAALMMEMRRELLRRGFTGPSFGTPQNGKLYVFER